MEFVLISFVLVFILFIIYYLYKKRTSIVLLSNSNLENPINKLTFIESLNLDTFNKALIDYNLSKSDSVLKSLVRVNPGDGVKIIESVNIIKENNSIIWELSKEGKKLLNADKVEWVTNNETGKLLPVVKDSKGTKFRELIKGTKSGKLARAAKLTNVVVNAAHIISGADLAQKLDLVNNKLDYLIESRKIDKLSELESLYYELRELISNDHHDNNRERILNVHNQIREIRIKWRNELEYHLNNIKDPNSRSFFNKLFSIDKNTDKRIYREITKFEDEVGLIDYCFALDFAICDNINQETSALNIELRRLEKTVSVLETKKDYFTGKFPEYNIDNNINYLSSIPKKYSKYVNQNLLISYNNDE